MVEIPPVKRKIRHFPPPHSRLKQALQGQSSALPWNERLHILLDSALGLSHLHCSKPQVLF
jgi:hypothetical protein